MKLLIVDSSNFARIRIVSKQTSAIFIFLSSMVGLQKNYCSFFMVQMQERNKGDIYNHNVGKFIPMTSLNI